MIGYCLSTFIKIYNLRDAEHDQRNAVISKIVKLTQQRNLNEQIQNELITFCVFS